jgi:hypothetical protein
MQDQIDSFAIENENLKEKLRDKDKKMDSLEEKLNDADRRSVISCENDFLNVTNNLLTIDVTRSFRSLCLTKQLTPLSRSVYQPLCLLGIIVKKV